MNPPCIVDRGDGPKIQGTRITVFTVYEYHRQGHSRDWIAATLELSSLQVQAALDYIRDNEATVAADYQKILARIQAGNPPQIESQFKANREKVKAWLARQPASHRG